MAAVSSDLATAFFGLARRHTAVAFNLRASILAVARRRTPVSICARAYAVGAKPAVVAGPGRLAISTRSRAHARRFAASAAATDEGSDLLTKIPPDDRIPATIITGFLGSGKVRCRGLCYQLPPVLADASMFVEVTQKRFLPATLSTLSNRKILS